MPFGSVLQERAYMMLRMNGGGGGEGSDYGSSEAGSYEYDDDEDAEDYEEDLEHHLRVHHHEHPAGAEGDGDEDVEGEGRGEGEGEDSGSEESEYEEEGFDEDEEVEPELDPAEYEDDEAYARALQDAEEREVAARLLALAGISECEYGWVFLQLASHFPAVAHMHFWFRFVGRAVEHVEDHVNDAQVVINSSVAWMELVFVFRSWNHWSLDEMKLCSLLSLSMLVMYTVALGCSVNAVEDKICQSAGANMISASMYSCCQSFWFCQYHVTLHK
jgi:E3 ubiquitin-protein ligase BIG BROTHER-like protein